MKYLLFTILFNTISVKIFCQTGIDYQNLYQLKIQDEDSTASALKLASIAVYRKEKDKPRRLESKKEFDRSGNLIRIVVIDYDYLKDTCITSIRRLSKKEFYVITRIKRTSLKKINSRNNDWFKYKEYLDISNSKNKYFVISSFYRIKSDSSFDIITHVDDKIIDSSNQKSLFAIDDYGDRIKLMNFDSTINNDTLIISKTEIDGVFKTIGRRYFLKNEGNPIKAEVIKYNNDSLLYNRTNIWAYDEELRIVLYKELQDGKAYVTESTIYDSANGTKTIYNDSYPSDNKTDKIWRYDSHNRIIESAKFSESNSVNNTTKYSYDEHGLLIKMSYFTNGKFKYAESFEHKFY